MLGYIHVISCQYGRRKSPGQGAVQIKHVCMYVCMYVGGGGVGCCCCWWLVMKVVVVALSLGCCWWVVVKVVEVVLSVGGSGGCW